MNRQQIAELFESFVDVAPEQREAWLAEHCVQDADARATLLRLIGEFQNQADFLGAPAALAAEAREALAQRGTPNAFGRYRVIRRLGVGGMGEVWLGARDDGEFEQRVAIKQVAYPTPGLVQRFRQERQILARLEHPNIARLIDGGVDAQGAPYLAMEYVDGVPITVYAEEHGLGLRARLQLFAEVCDAVQFAHRNLIVHRDLKPSNIFVAADAMPKLLDFGIAKVLDAAANDATAMRLLTPDYAAPEQIAGSTITTATDVYALGVVLHELLTGRRPKRANTGEVAANGVAVPGDAQPPSQCVDTSIAAGRTRRKLLRGDLDRIVLTALAVQPERRYSSAEALAADLRRYLDGRTVAAQGAGAAYRARKFVARNRVAVAAAAVAVVTLIVTTLWSLYQARVAYEQARAAAEQREAAQMQAGRNAAMTDFLLKLVGSSNTPSASASDLLRQASDHLLGDAQMPPERRAAMIGVLADVYAERRDAKGAQRLLRPLLTDKGEALPDEIYARAACNLGLAEHWLNEDAEAKRWIDAGLARAERLSGSARALHALCLSDRGILLSDENALDAAKNVEREAVAEIDASGPAFDDKAATVHANYGDTLRSSGDPLAGREQYRHAIEILERAGRSESADMAMATAGIAACDRTLGLIARAAQEREQSNALRLRVSGPSYGMAVQLLNAAGDRIELADPAAALALIDRAESMQREYLGEKNNIFAILSAAHRARALAQLGREAEAEVEFAKAQQVYAQSTTPNPYGESLHMYRAEVLLASAAANAELLGSADAELAAAEKGLRALGSAGSLQLPRVLLDRAEIAVAMKHWELAAGRAAEARALFAVLSAPDGWGLAACDAVSAQIDLARGKRDGVQARFDSAAQRLAVSLGADHPRTRHAHALAAETAVDTSTIAARRDGS
ncbi:MAG: serine/threonine protein kinase [Rudaea sp.]|nr:MULTISPECIES: serine/threonine-protein kinase [unclassified Rudaea]MBN8888555.1 serine/threonine protein kinase [Rudaea sp.]